MENSIAYFQTKFSEASFKSLMNFVKAMALTCAIAGFLFGIKVYSNGYSPSKYTEKFEKIYEDTAMDDAQRFLDVKTLFDLKYKHYKNVSASIGGIQKGVIIILIISFMVLIFGAREIPFFGFTIPDTLIYIVVYFGGLYLFANFGLTLNSLIENRISLHAYVNYMENASGGIHYTNSIRHLLSDASFGDNWFSHYFDIYQGRNPLEKTNIFANAIGWLGLYGFYAVIIGLFQGVVLTTTIEFLRRKGLKLKYAYFMISFLILLYMGCATAFIIKFQYPIFWVSSICLVLTIWLFFWHSNGKKIYMKFSKQVKTVPAKKNDGK